MKFEGNLKRSFEANFQSLGTIDNYGKAASYLYKSEEIQVETHGEQICSLICSFFEKNSECDMFTYNNGQCFFGRSSVISSLIMDEDFSNSTFYLTEGNKDSIGN